MTSEKKDQKYEFRAHRNEPKRTNGSAPSRPWRTPDCYAVVFQHVSPVKANLNDGYIGEPRGEAPADMLLAVFGGPCEDTDSWVARCNDRCSTVAPGHWDAGPLGRPRERQQQPRKQQRQCDLVASSSCC